MNKELILKYKKEFDHWVNGGEVLFYDNHHSTWFKLHSESTWDATSTLSEELEFNSYGYIINDEYVELRKALAEGKTIQANLNYWAFPETPEKQWDDVISNKIDEVFKKYGVNNIRIKPEEPKFKVGDWVVVTSDFQTRSREYFKGDIITYHDRVQLNGSIGRNENNIRLWQPQPGEWCWFWDKYTDSFLLTKFHSISCDSEGTTIYKTDGWDWLHCEPFIGELPSFIKDK